MCICIPLRCECVYSVGMMTGRIIPVSLSLQFKAIRHMISGCFLNPTFPTLISSCDTDYNALHRPVARDTADPTVQTLLVLCSTVHQAHKDRLVLMQQKATENIKHIC